MKRSLLLIERGEKCLRMNGQDALPATVCAYADSESTERSYLSAEGYKVELLSVGLTSSVSHEARKAINYRRVLGVSLKTDVTIQVNQLLVPDTLSSKAGLRRLRLELLIADHDYANWREPFSSCFIPISLITSSNFTLAAWGRAQEGLIEALSILDIDLVTEQWEINSAVIPSKASPISVYDSRTFTHSL